MDVKNPERADANQDLKEVHITRKEGLEEEGLEEEVENLNADTVVKKPVVEDVRKNLVPGEEREGRVDLLLDVEGITKRIIINVREVMKIIHTDKENINLDNNDDKLQYSYYKIY